MSSNSSHLGGSWAANDILDEGNISWAEESEPSDVEDVRTRPAPVTPPKKLPTPRKSVSNSRQVYNNPEPQFVMPSIDHKPSRRTTQALPSKKQFSSRQVVTSPETTGSRPTSGRNGSAATDKAFEIFSGSADYVLDVIATTLKTLKKPISWTIAAYLFAGGLVLLQNLVTSSIGSAFSPICRIPGMSYLPLPMCHSPYSSTSDQMTISSSNKKPANPEFSSLMSVQSKFETVLEDSAAGIGLPLVMKRSETSIRDLREVVRFSQIPSKNELLLEFDSFVETAQVASRDLQKFNSRVGRAVDNVLSTARWTQRVLDDIDYQTSSRGLIPAFISDTLLAPFQPIQFTESKLLDQYVQHTRIISDEIQALIEEAQALLSVLQNLEDRLDLIHSISHRDDLAAQATKDEILAQLWTMLGGNRSKLGKVDKQRQLLGQVSDYRKIAYAHVAGVVLKLQAMGAELEELRTRVGSAEVMMDRGIQGVPLSVHIESIKLGVERLQSQRENARQLETNHNRRILDRHDLPEIGGNNPRYLDAD